MTLIGFMNRLESPEARVRQKLLDHERAALYEALGKEPPSPNPEFKWVTKSSDALSKFLTLHEEARRWVLRAAVLILGGYVVVYYLFLPS